MPTVTEIEGALGNLVQNAVYPGGTAQPSIAGVTIDISSGWPLPEEVNQFMRNGMAMVSIWPMPSMNRVSRWWPQRIYQQVSINSPTLTLNVSGSTVTVGGVVSSPQAVLIALNKTPYGYQVQPSDTLNSIAANLAALIPGASAAGSVITLTGAYRINAGVSVVGKEAIPLKRQQAVYKIITRAPTPELRAVICDAIETNLALPHNERIIIPPGFAVILRWRGYGEDDSSQKNRIYKRELIYEVEYDTTATRDAHSITYPFSELTGQ